MSLSPGKEHIWKSDVMIRKSTIANVLIFILLVCSLAFVPASASERPTFEKMPDNPNFIVNKGTMPEITNETEWINRSGSVMRCWVNLTGTTPSCSIPRDAITGIIFTEDFLIVEIGSNYYTKINDSQFEEIYQDIETQCKKEGVSEIPVTFQWQEGTHFPLPDYGPKAIENAKKDTLFITSKGTMPVIEDNEKKWKWLNLLDRGYSNDGWIHPYTINGPVLGFELSYNGYLIIRLDAGSPEKVNESLIDEIYQEIDIQCRKEGINEVPVVFFWQPFNNHVIYVDHNGYYVLSDKSNPDSSFEEVESNPKFIAARGTIPIFTSEDEKKEWSALLHRLDGNRAVSQLIYPSGIPIVLFGVNEEGYIEVGLDSYTPEKVNESVIDDIYNVIYAEAIKENISEVPVVFTWEHIILDEEADIDLASEETSEENKTEQQAPGFTSSMLVLSLLLLVEMKRKVL